MTTNPIMLKIILLLLLTNGCYLNGQTQIDKSTSAFDMIEYYPDFVVKCVYKAKKGIKHGYAIEFNEIGQATSIGKYYKGKKEGKWINDSGIITYFKKGELEMVKIPGCETGTATYKENFRSLYAKLVCSKSHQK